MRTYWNRAAVALFLYSVCAVPSLAQQNRRPEPSAAALLQTLAGAANSAGRQALSANRIEDWVTWDSWALVYRHGIEHLPRSMTAGQLAHASFNSSKQQYLQAVAQGNRPLAALMKASAAFWADIYNQLKSGSNRLQVRFPREMLNRVDGVPGTPWGPMDGQTAGLNSPAGAGKTAPTVGRAVVKGICPSCGGAKRRVCMTCKGSGFEDYTPFASFGESKRSTCTSCGRSGFKTCELCGGTGVWPPR